MKAEPRLRLCGVPSLMTQPDDDIEQAVAMLRRTLQQRVTPEVRARHLGSVERKAAQMRFEQRRSLRAARRPRVALLAALVGAMLVGTSGAALAASGEATPGQLLYPMKRGGEEVRLIVATPFSAQGRVQLDIAEARVHEAVLVAEAQPDKVLPLIAQAREAIAAAEAVGEPQVAEVVEVLDQQVDTAIAMAAVTADDVAAALPEGGLSQLAMATETDTTTTAAQPGDPSTAGVAGGAGSVGSASPDDVETDPVTGAPILGTGTPESSTATPSPSPSPSLSPTPPAKD